MGLKPRVTTYGQHADLDEPSSLPGGTRKLHGQTRADMLSAATRLPIAIRFRAGNSRDARGPMLIIMSRPISDQASAIRC